MTIALISDTHDNSPAIVWIINYLNDHQIKVALHAGDMINPGILYRFRDHYQGHLHFVFGNNDGEQALAMKRAMEIDNITCHLWEYNQELEGKKIFMTHYSSMATLAAKSGEFDLCVGGHDHQFRVEQYGKSVFANPGNTVTKDPWLPQEADKLSSFALVELDRMEITQISLPKEYQG